MTRPPRWEDAAPLALAERQQLTAWVAAVGHSEVVRRLGWASRFVLRQALKGSPVAPGNLAALRALLAADPPALDCQHPGCQAPVACPPVGTDGRRPRFCEAHRWRPGPGERRREPARPAAPACPICGGPLAQDGRLTYCRERRCDAALSVRRPA